MKKKILGAVLFLVLLTGAFITWKLFGPVVRVQGKENEYLYIKTGSTLADVKQVLIQQKFLPGTAWFGMATKMLKYNTVKPGRYKMEKGMSVVNLVRMLRNGTQSPVKFVITKLRTRENLAARLGHAFEADSLQVITFLGSADSLKEFGLDSNTVMAAAMPFSYSMKWNTSPRDIFRQFYQAYANFWTPERKQKADSLGLTPEKACTLASIIDEETNAPVDRPLMASVYLNRVAQGIPLGADPTLKFALKNFGLKRIYNEHKKVVSPYNTYVNKGLPPGPICTPQLQTIEAVLNAPKTDYLFFVANSNFDGTHIFTTNNSDHSKYARLYQKELDKRKVK